MGAKYFTRLGLTALIVAGLAAPAGARQGNPKVSPRDQLTISVFGVDDLGGKFKVDADGTINFPPLTGSIKVVGLTAREVEVEIARRLQDPKAGGIFSIAPRVTAELEQVANKKVSVAGAGVHGAGQFTYAGEMRVLTALLLAGSRTTDASDEAFITRAAEPIGSKNKIITVNLRELLTKGNMAENLVLEDGDILTVPTAAQVFIGGYVNRPGAYPIMTGTTVQQAILLAGGLSERGSQKGIKILRDKKELKDVKLDAVVMPGDTITIKAKIF
jgi:polysaccharide export outer membrane protein